MTYGSQLDLGVVGGVVGLFALAAAALLSIRRRSRGGTSPLPPPTSHTPGMSEYKVQPTSPTFTPGSQNPPFNPYYVRSPLFSFHRLDLLLRRSVPSEP